MVARACNRKLPIILGASVLGYFYPELLMSARAYSNSLGKVAQLVEEGQGRLTGNRAVTDSTWGCSGGIINHDAVYVTSVVGASPTQPALLAAGGAARGQDPGTFPYYGDDYSRSSINDESVQEKPVHHNVAMLSFARGKYADLITDRIFSDRVSEYPKLSYVDGRITIKFRPTPNRPHILANNHRNYLRRPCVRRGEWTKTKVGPEFSSDISGDGHAALLLWSMKWINQPLFIDGLILSRIANGGRVTSFYDGGDVLGMTFRVEMDDDYQQFLSGDEEDDPDVDTASEYVIEKNPGPPKRAQLDLKREDVEFHYVDSDLIKPPSALDKILGDISDWWSGLNMRTMLMDSVNIEIKRSVPKNQTWEQELVRYDSSSDSEESFGKSRDKDYDPNLDEDFNKVFGAITGVRSWRLEGVPKMVYLTDKPYFVAHGLMSVAKCSFVEQKPYFISGPRTISAINGGYLEWQDGSITIHRQGVEGVCTMVTATEGKPSYAMGPPLQRSELHADTLDMLSKVPINSCKSVQDAVAAECSQGAGILDAEKDKLKDKFCRSFFVSGRCKFGDKCRFSHDASGVPFQYTVGEDSGRQCYFYLDKGSCKSGCNCKFRHGGEKTHPSSDLAPTEEVILETPVEKVEVPEAMFGMEEPEDRYLNSDPYHIAQVDRVEKWMEAVDKYRGLSGRATNMINLIPSFRKLQICHWKDLETVREKWIRKFKGFLSDGMYSMNKTRMYGEIEVATMPSAVYKDYIPPCWDHTPCSEVAMWFGCYDEFEYVDEVKLVYMPLCLSPKSQDSRPFRDKLDPMLDDYVIVMQPLLRVKQVRPDGVYYRYLLSDAKREDKLALKHKSRSDWRDCLWCCTSFPTLDKVNGDHYFNRCPIEHLGKRETFVFSKAYISAFMLVELLSRRINLPHKLSRNVIVERAVRSYSEESMANSHVEHVMTSKNVPRHTLSLVSGIFTGDMSSNLEDF